MYSCSLPLYSIYSLHTVKFQSKNKWCWRVLASYFKKEDNVNKTAGFFMAVKHEVFPPLWHMWPVCKVNIVQGVHIMTHTYRVSNGAIFCHYIATVNLNLIIKSLLTPNIYLYVQPFECFSQWWKSRSTNSVKVAENH